MRNFTSFLYESLKISVHKIHVNWHTKFSSEIDDLHLEFIKLRAEKADLCPQVVTY